MPALFPAGGTESTVTYQGTSYTLRSYGTGNVLGFTPEGGIYGVGPYTGGILTTFGKLSDYAAQIVADSCRVQRVDCALPIITAQPLNFHSSDGWGEVYFELQYQSPGPASVQWQYSSDGGRRFNDIANATSTRLSSGWRELGHYRAKVTNIGGSVLTQPARWIRNYANSSADLFPVAPGSQWTYTNNRNSIPTIVRVVGPHVFDGRTTTAIERRDGLDGSAITEYYSIDADGVRNFIDPIDQTSDELRLLSGQRILSFPLSPFNQVDAIVPAGADVDQDGMEDSIRIRSDVSVERAQLVKTAAGLFAGAWRVQQTFIESIIPSGGDHAATPYLTLLNVAWWVPGVGMVKEASRLMAPGVDDSYEMSLHSYVTGDMSNDVVLPLLRFEQPSRFDDPGATLSVAIGDLDGDGVDDLVYTAIGYRHGLGVHVIWGRSDGRVEPVVPPDLGECTYMGRLAAADFDGDGRIEVAVANSTCGVRILQWNARREVGTRQVLKTDDSPLLVHAGDVDGSGRPALIVSQWYRQPSSVTIWRADGAGRLQKGETLDFDGQGLSDIAVADLDGNGLPDFVATLNVAKQGDGLVFRLQRTAGEYGAPMHLASTWPLVDLHVAVGDIDGDGRPEIVAPGYVSGEVAIHRVSADGKVTTSNQPWGKPKGLRIADVNGDGRLDLIMGLDRMDNTLDIRYQQADGTLGAADSVFNPNNGPSIYTHSLAVGDFNGDGRLDITYAGSRLLQRAVPVTASMLGDRKVQTAKAFVSSGTLHRLRSLHLARRLALGKMLPSR